MSGLQKINCNTYQVSDSIQERLVRANKVTKTIEVLQELRNYQLPQLLGSGTYGDVVKMFDPARKIDLAIKIVPRDKVEYAETTVWPKICHPNIIPLIDMFNIESLEVAVFIMPAQLKALDQTLVDPNIKQMNGLFTKVKEWLYEILLALDYLFTNSLCHLDLKVDNILISHNLEAVLCDFTFLNDSTKILSRNEIGLPICFRPPEALELQTDVELNGPAIDMWGFGMLATNMITGLLLNYLKDESNWMKGIYPTLFHVLQIQTLGERAICAFPGDKITINEIELAQNFIFSFLKTDCRKRRPPQKAIHHPFLKREFFFENEVDEIWIMRSDVMNNQNEEESKMKLGQEEKTLSVESMEVVEEDTSDLLKSFTFQKDTAIVCRSYESASQNFLKQAIRFNSLPNQKNYLGTTSLAKFDSDKMKLSLVTKKVMCHPYSEDILHKSLMLKENRQLRSENINMRSGKYLLPLILSDNDLVQMENKSKQKKFTVKENNFKENISESSHVKNIPSELASDKKISDVDVFDVFENCHQKEVIGHFLSVDTLFGKANQTENYVMQQTMKCYCDSKVGVKYSDSFMKNIEIESDYSKREKDPFNFEENTVCSGGQSEQTDITSPNFENIVDGNIESKPKSRKQRLNKWIRKRFSSMRKLFCCISNRNSDENA